MRQLLANAGGRRFLVTLISGAGTWVLCLLGRIDGTVYQWTTIGIVGAFVGAATWQKFKAPGSP